MKLKRNKGQRPRLDNSDKTFSMKIIDSIHTNMWVIYVRIEEAGRSEESFPNSLKMLFSDMSAFYNGSLWRGELMD